MTPVTASDGFTLGVEEEYQLVDPASGAMRSHASELRREDWTGELIAELQETTIEIATPICAHVAEAEQQLRRLRFQASTVAESHGVAIVAAGLHPFSNWIGHTRPPLERYRAIEARYGRIARDEHIFGMHVHVGLPDGTTRLPVLNIVRHYLPHLLALSASSPFFEGTDTGFASYRTILWRRWPHSGIPPRFASEAEFARYVQTQLDAGSIADAFNLYWSARPHPHFPTVEIRVMDVSPNLTDAVAIVALARALVHAAATGALVDAAAGRCSDALEQELLRANEWRVAREGLNARLIDASAGAGHMSVRDAIRRLLDAVGGSADMLGDGTALHHIEALLARGNAAERMRDTFQHSKGTRGLVHWLMHETLAGTGLDHPADHIDHPLSSRGRST